MSHGALTINAILLLIGVLLAVLPGIGVQKGVMGVILLLPLSAGLSQQIDAFLGISILVLPNAGLDLVAGFFLSYFGQLLIKRRFSLRDFALPWPVSLLLFVITISTALAIIRNIRQSATETSFFGLIFNLMHFRPIGWHDDYMPIADWMAYSIAGALIIFLLSALRGVENPNRLIFRPLVAGLFLAFLMGVLQSITSVGLPVSLLDFRRDRLGFAAIGFQPDIHSFAGHMLLGAVGLWAYFQTCRGRLERAVLLVVVSFSWIGLLISKSRASLLIAICASLAVLLIYIWRAHRRWFYFICGVITVIFSVLITILIQNIDTFATYPIFSWLVEPIQLIKNKDFTSLSVLGGASGSRFEIWSAAFNMIKAFPLMGVGQGNFYHLSADIAFSKSHFLALNGGENAHNYFLQTFAELGLVGMIAFVLMFSLPFIHTQNRRLLLPASLGIFALFLGNVYSHSFLVRENLLLCSALLGLMYFAGFKYEFLNPYDHAHIKKIATRKRMLVIAVFFLGLASANEVIRSFHTKIFEIGVNCFQARPLTGDGWTSGILELMVPEKAKGISFEVFRPKNHGLLKNNQIYLRMDLLTFDNKAVASKSVTILNGPSQQVNFNWNHELKNELDGRKLKIRASNCFTPRNLGINEDSRILSLRFSGLLFF